MKLVNLGKVFISKPCREYGYVDCAGVIGSIEDLFSNIMREYANNVHRNMLDNGGAVYYMNGRNGTMFDCEENHHLSAFYNFYKNERGFIKVLIYDDNDIVGYVFHDSGSDPYVEFEGVLDVENEDCITFREFARVMNAISDKVDKYNMSIRQLSTIVEYI